MTAQEMKTKASELRAKASLYNDDWEDLICEAKDLEKKAANLEAAPAFIKNPNPFKDQ